MFILPFNQRIVAGTASQVVWQQIGGDGEPVDPGAITVTITRSDGTAVVTAQPASGTGAAARTYPLTAAQTATIDRLTILWQSTGVTIATTEADVVAAPSFSNAELRAAEPSVKDETKYPAPVIAIARLQVEAFFERVTHRRFVPGFTMEMLPGARGRDLVVSHPDVRRVRSAALYWDPSVGPTETLGALELGAIPPSPTGIVTRYQLPWSAMWVRIGYEHGLLTSPPDVKRQQMRLCRELLVNESKGQVPDNATSWQSTDTGWSAILVTPGVRGAHTKLPTVNECLDAWTFDQVGMA